MTGDQKYRDMGWSIFQAIERHCKVPTGGYSGIKNVDAPLDRVEFNDRMETFMMVRYHEMKLLSTSLTLTHAERDSQVSLLAVLGGQHPTTDR